MDAKTPGVLVNRVQKESRPCERLSENTLTELLATADGQQRTESDNTQSEGRRLGHCGDDQRAGPHGQVQRRIRGFLHRNLVRAELHQRSASGSRTTEHIDI